jgi:hypothetical protein
MFAIRLHIQPLRRKCELGSLETFVNFGPIPGEPKDGYGEAVGRNYWSLPYQVSPTKSECEVLTNSQFSFAAADPFHSQQNALDYVRQAEQ